MPADTPAARPGGETAEQELKPCPFCGGAAHYTTRDTPHARSYGVECDRCFAELDSMEWERADAASQWNTRAAPAPDPEAAELAQWCDQQIEQYQAFAEALAQQVDGHSPGIHRDIDCFKRIAARLRPPTDGAMGPG